MPKRKIGCWTLVQHEARARRRANYQNKPEQELQENKERFAANRAEWLQKKNVWRPGKIATCKLIVREWFDEKNRECEECKHKGPWCHFEAAHKNRAEKLYGISKLVHAGKIEALRAELPKCRLLCLFCHREQTFDEIGCPRDI